MASAFFMLGACGGPEKQVKEPDGPPPDADETGVPSEEEIDASDDVTDEISAALSEAHQSDDEGAVSGDGDDD